MKILLDTQLSKEKGLTVDLNEASKTVAILEEELQKDKNAVGLAAPQLGIAQMVAIVRIPPDILINIINPKILSGYDPILFQEGCLSFPGQIFQTVRWSEITLEMEDIYGDYTKEVDQRYLTAPTESAANDGRRIITFAGDSELELLTTVAIQHETAHLFGLTMYDFKPTVVPRNGMCVCGSGKKSKKCHGYFHWNENLTRLK